ncbi:MAG TPA: hypothetical protein VFE37_07160 [Chloroflexota bacterium]|nr:hypothetical protein [Chloroflexota bacterium]
MVGACGAVWRRNLFLALTLLALLCALPPRVAGAADDEPWLTQATTYFTIYYTAADSAAAAYYAGEADELYAAVASVFDHGPAAPVALRLYSTGAAYAGANPIAGVMEGVVAHADARRGEIALAVDRLARAGPAATRDTIRHELMHLVASELSADRLPVGFQEGLAQYAEREASDRQRLVQSLERAQSTGRLLTWETLNDQRRFLSRVNVAYPEALSIVSFLADRYGLGSLRRFMLDLGAADRPWTEALEAVYGRSATDLEAEWRAYLPSYYSSRWEINQIRSLDLSDARAQLAAGEYALARPQVEEARRLYADLEQPARVEEADRYLERIAAGLAAGDLAAQGRTRLAERAYTAARDLLVEADQRYADADDERWRPTLAEPLAAAERGAEAEARLAQATSLVAAWRYPEGRERSAEAAALYLGLGDTSGWEQAQSLHSEAESGQRRLALLLLSAGGAVLVGLGIQHARGRVAAAPSRTREEGIAL